jgi:hypothetical protein
VFGLGGRRGSQGCLKTASGGAETAMDLLDVDQFGSVDLMQRRLDRLNLEHAIGNYFAFQFA